MNQSIRLGILTAIVAISMVLVSVKSGRACTELPKEPEPLWLKGDYTRPGYYIGKAPAERGGGKFEAQLAAAKERAFADLAKKIAVNISSQMVDRSTSEIRGGKEIATQSIELTVETKVAQYLRDVDYKTWMNRDKCIVWALAYVSEASVEEVKRELLNKQRFETMMGVLQQANRYRIKVKKVESIKEARRILDGLDFKYLPDESGKDFYVNLLDRKMKEAEETQE